MNQWSIANGDILSVLPDFRENSFDALLCDPPYGFSFMGKAWDYDVPSVELWRECLRVLKPGAPLVAFGGSRTYHRLACGIEDAGFELRDCLMWLYGKGFPKSLNLKDAWQGYGTALKPAHEPIVLARKPVEGTLTANVQRYGVGGLNIDGCRGSAEGNVKWTEPRGGIWTTDPDAKAELVGGGRWPANLILSHTEECRPTGRTVDVKNGTAVKHRGVVAGTGASFGIAKPVGTPDAGYGTQQVEVWECSPDCPIALLDASVAPTTSVPYPQNEATGNVLPFTKRTPGGYADSGGPSRFFYCSKVSTKEREAGCEGLPMRSAGEVTGGREDGSAGLDNPRAGAGRTGGARNVHPTLKPISLTTWLARLICPPRRPDGSGGVILVPFAGAGSEMIGCLKAGWSGVFGIEREAEYVTIAKARLAHWCPESQAA